MKKNGFLILAICSFITVFALLFTAFTLRSDCTKLESIVKAQRANMIDLESSNMSLNLLNEKMATQIDDLNRELENAKKELSELKVERKTSINTSRGEYTRRTIMRVTAYDLSVESCGKLPSHPEYGITTSGKRVREWHTIAAGPNMPFGTKVYIPYFKDSPNGGIFIVEDRGGAIKNGRIDVYMEDGQDCKEFGVKELEVYIMK